MAKDLERSHLVARFARWSERVVASPYAALTALVLIGVALYALPPLGFPLERVADLHFLVAVLTLLLVFLIEHNERRDTAATHVKLDAILKALEAGQGKIGVEDLPAQRIEEIRERQRESARR